MDAFYLSMGTGPISPRDSTAPCRHVRTAGLFGEKMVAPNHCWLLFLFQWRRGNGRRRWGGRQCGSRSCRHWSCAGCRWRRRGIRRSDGGVMPMAVLDGPHLSRWSFAGRLRRRCKLLLWLARDGEGLRLRGPGDSGRSGFRGRGLRLVKEVSARRTNDHTASSRQHDDQTKRRSFL
jgi:hypothetical protein